MNNASSMASGNGHRILARLRRLETLQYIIPCLMQLVLVVALLAARQWMVALMLSSGVITTAIPLIVRMIGEERPGEVAPPSSPVSGGATSNDAHEDINSLHCGDLEELLGLAASDQPMLWRTIIHRWLRGPDLAASIANTSSGTYPLDLGRQGPHALVAGTTGSGKSVLLQSWCLAMATLNSPEHLRFVFMDFKGGSTFNGLAALPHVVGNVCDLNLSHAIRALLALERELKRRERLVAIQGVHHIQALRHREPALIVVIDEFHALKDQLPDYVDRLVRIAALGRSLGMHIIACTQNPLGQIGTDMKANMSLKLCLRVLDGMQSGELLGGDARAASISPRSPGIAFCNDGERLTALRVAPARDVGRLVDAMSRAFRFMGADVPRALFTPPLPSHVSIDMLSAPPPGHQPPRGVADPDMRRHHGVSDAGPSDNAMSRGNRESGIAFALGDDSVAFFTATLPLWRSNVAIIGPRNRGKTTLLRHLAKQLRNRGHVPTWLGERPADAPHRHGTPTVPAMPSIALPGHQNQAIWLVDDADDLLDPLSTDRHAGRLRELLHDPDTMVIFCAKTSRYIRIPQHCTIRVVFPTGERAVDLADGIPSELLRTFNPEDYAIPGRAVLIREGLVRMVQCTAPAEDHATAQIVDEISPSP